MAGSLNRMAGGATSGIGRALGSIAMGDQAQQQAYDGEMLTQSRLAQALAQVRQLDAAARLHDAQADEAVGAGQRAAARPGITDLAMAASAGVDLPTLNAFREKLTTGRAPMVPMGPETADGQMGVGSAQFSPEASSKIAAALTRFLPASTAEKDINPEQWAKAQGAYRSMDLGDQVLGGQRTAADVGRAQAAVEAKPMYHAGENGAVLDLFGGGLNESGGLARANIGLVGAKTGAEKATAADRYASADAHKASAGKTRAETDQLLTAPKGKYDPTTGMIIDERGATARPVIGPDGKPLAGKEAALNGEQANALTFATRMQAAHNILGQMADQGVMTPGQIKLAADATPLIGTALGTGVNMLPTALGGPSEKQQQVEQAQRDFVNAVLRRESGAAISMGEFTNAAKQYFPQPGDSPAVLAQKKASRQRVIDGMLQAVPPSRRPNPAQPQTGGATGSWGDGWKIERVGG